MNHEDGENLVHCSCYSCRSAQFEHTVVVTADGVDILTKLPEEDTL